MKIVINPVLRKEYLTKMRGWKAAGMLGGYLTVLALFAGLILYSMFGNIMYSAIDSNATTNIYSSLAILQFTLLMFVTPALTSGSISGEREKQTLELLISTKLKPFSIVLGKLLAALSQVFFLMLASVPVYAIVFMFGGISAFDLLQLFAYYMVTVLFIGCIGIFYSTFLKKTTGATVMTYLTIGAITVGSLFVTLFYFSIFYTNGNNPTGIIPILHTNPIAGFADILRIQLAGNSMQIPGMTVDPNNTGFVITPWLGNIIFDIVCSVGLLFASAWRINPLNEKWTKRANENMIALEKKGKSKKIQKVK